MKIINIFCWNYNNEKKKNKKKKKKLNETLNRANSLLNYEIVHIANLTLRCTYNVLFEVSFEINIYVFTYAYLMYAAFNI